MKKRTRLRLDRRNQYDEQGNLIKRKARRKGDAPIYNGNRFNPKEVKNIITSIQRRLNYNKKGTEVDKLVAKKFGCSIYLINEIRRGKSHYNSTKIVQTSDYSKPTKRVHKVIEYNTTPCTFVPKKDYAMKSVKSSHIPKMTEEQSDKFNSLMSMFKKPEPRKV